MNQVRQRLNLYFSFAILIIGTASCSPTTKNEIQENADGSKNTNKIQVPEGYLVEMVAGPDLVDFPMYGTLDETGRLFLFESIGHVYKNTEEALKNPQFRIKLLEDLDGNGVYDKSTIFADKVGFPQGGVFYKGSLYASSAPDLLKFTDTNGDGVADKREVLLSGWILNVNANSLVGPFLGPDGWLYMTNAIMGFDVTTKEGERLKGETSRIWRLRPDGSNLEWISAGGMNNPVELTFTESGEPIGTMTYFTDPKAGQRDALIYYTEGGVYPKPNNNITRDNLPRTGELLSVISKYSRVSPAGIYRYRNTALGEGFKDNLFSAQFNTHRIIRHKLFREGASFRTEDEVFFLKDDEDFHPTDVLEDADGSLLVVETGGWFIEGCPLSQVSKPELKGSVYRVRKKGAKKAEDAYGNKITWENISPEQLAYYLEDSRPFVQDRAVQKLVDHGDASVNPLIKLLEKSTAADARTKAVFALYRIGTSGALAAARTGLLDKDLQVRVAAARSAGLAKDKQAGDKLMELVQIDEPAVRRQAATALGQIGDSRAIPSLLAASNENQERFVEHAIIYALITMNQPEMVEKGLAHISPQVQNTALIALDQMKGYTLNVKQMTPFFSSENQQLKNSAFWIAASHPEWSNDLSGLIAKRLKGESLNNEEKALYGDLLVSFCGDEGIQKFIAEQIQMAPADRKIFLLETMAKCGIKEFPKVWVQQIGQQLQVNDPQVQAKALELIRLRKIEALTQQLHQTAGNEKNIEGIRLEAIGALLSSDPKIKDPHFKLLFDHIQKDKDAPLRQQAAHILSMGKLSENQLLKIADEFLPHADAFILPRLMPVFQGASNRQAGKALANTLLNSPTLDSYTEENVKIIFANYPSELNPEVDELLEKLRKTKGNRLERLHSKEKLIPKGDLEKGRILYFGKAACFSCHTIGPEGGSLGPDLTSIQKDRSAHDLLEAIVYPSATFVREYETYKIKTRDKQYTGIIQEQTPDAIVLATSPQTSVRIARNEIESTEISDISMMPQGLDQLLTDQEMADLMAFLLGQDQDPETDQAILR